MGTKQKMKNKKKLRRKERAEQLERLAAGERPPTRFCLMAKPMGPTCNLRCTYCFYLEKQALFPDNESYRMSDEVLEAYVREYITSQPSDEVAFHWQGGEPMLAGLGFFRKAVELQKQHAGEKRITNTIQTNGTLIDQEWARFLAKHGFLVGLSLDGPREVHDRYRLDAGGQPTFDTVMQSMKLLEEHEVEFNVLCSVTLDSCAKPREIYNFFRDHDVGFIQFMPIVERLPDADATELGLQLAVGVRSGEGVETVRMTPWSVEPESYGDFLVAVFDEWVAKDVGTVGVMNFEWAMAAWLGRSPGVCQWMPQCGHSPIVEHNGDVYACDHYVYPDYRLGNILTDDLQKIMQSAEQRKFGESKELDLPKHCTQCGFLPACRGGCPKRRFVKTPDGKPGLNYLCEAYKKFLAHAGPHFQAIAQLMQQGEPAARIMESNIVIVKPPQTCGLHAHL